MDLNEFKKIIKRDKHTLIEGKITEYLFCEDIYPILKSRGNGLSLNWWVVCHNNKFILFKYMPEEYCINKYDKKVINRLNDRDIDYYQIFVKDDKFFCLIVILNIIQKRIF